MSSATVLQAADPAIAERVQSFAAEVIAPAAAAMAQGTGPAPGDVVRRAGEHGLAGLLVPREHGGAGAAHTDFAAFIEAVARRCASSSVILDVHLSVGTEPLVLFGTEAQKRELLPAMAAGEATAAFALTEPQSGSDAAALQTRAEPDGDGWRLTGTKAFITNCSAAQIYTVIARTGDGTGGISAFLVDGDAPGLGFGEPLRKLGLHGSITGELILDGVPVPAGRRLGAPGDGFRVAMAALDSGRIGISAQAVGIARGAVDDIVAAWRAEPGRQSDTQLLAEIEARTVAAADLTRHAAACVDAGLQVTRIASAAKLYATDTAVFAAHAAVELLGPESAAGAHPSAIRLCDAKACQIYEGTNQIQRLVIGRQLLRTPQSR